MEPHHVAIIGLFVIAAILPGIGLWRVYRKSRGEWEAWNRGPHIEGEAPTIGQFSELSKYWHASMKRGPLVAFWDATFVAAGLLCGTVASIWAVLDTI